MLKRFVFILGGARSGKSAYALKRAKELAQKTLFVATASSEYPDREMKSRIKLHQKHRPRSWKTLEIEGEEIVSYLEKFSQRYKVVIIDCLAFLISNLLLKGQKESQIKKQIKNLAKFLSQKPFFIIVVSNEVGSGVVPENSLARRFRDLLGWTNQIMAQKADEVILVSAGLPLFLKNEKR